MDGALDQSTANSIEIDRPWFSNELAPIYRWTFPVDATDNELRACLQAREGLAILVHYSMAWIIDMSKITRAPAPDRIAVCSGSFRTLCQRCEARDITSTTAESARETP